MALSNTKLLALLALTLGSPLMAELAIAAPSAGSLGNQLQQDPIKPGDRSLPVEHDLIPPPPPAASDSGVGATSEGTIHLSRVLFDGARVMPPQLLNAVVEPWLNRDVTMSDLQKMTAAVEQLYAQRGFLAVRVLIPQQSMQGGALTLHVIEGRFALPKVSAATPREQAGAQRIVEAATCQAPCANPPPVMTADVDRALYLLNDLPGVSATATLKAGDLPGTTLLDVNVAPVKSFSAYVGANNHGNRYTGLNQFNAGVALNSLVTLGDQITLDGVTSGEALEHHTGLQQYGLGYSLPVGPYGTRVGAGYTRLNYVLNGAFEPLDAEGDSDTYSAFVSHPLWLSHLGRLDVRGSYEYSKFSDRLLQTLDRTRNTQATSAEVSGYRFWDNSLAGFSLKSTMGRLNYDDAVDRTIDQQTRRSQGNFFKQRIDGYWQQSLAPQWSTFAAVRSQLTDSNLDSSQSLLLGGPGGVRAFNADSTSVNQGIQGTLELRHNSQLWNQNLTAAAFYDRAEGRINRHGWAGNPDSNAHLRLEGAGAYLNLNFSQKYNARLTYAQRLSDNLPTSQDANRIWLDASMSF